jgi:glycogen synthase
MHVLMLGWEFPPFIAGGLGTACHGLTKALDRQDVDVTFVLPKVIDRSQASHVNLLSPTAASQDAPLTAAMLRSISRSETVSPSAAPSAHQINAAQGKAQLQIHSHQVESAHPESKAAMAHVRFIGVPAGFNNPYQRPGGPGLAGGSESSLGRWVVRRGVRTFLTLSEPAEPDDVESVSYGDLQAAAPPHGSSAPVGGGEDYGGDLLWQVERFARFCVASTSNLKFDVVHAHDWMTYPAGLAIASLTGKPLVVHVHSTEFDRSGVHINQKIYDIERRGMHGAMRVVAVSQLTKNVIMRRFSVPDGKVTVVYNGVDLEPTQGERSTAIFGKDKIVLYFGRITYQKGPEYFIYAAKRVLDLMPNVKFVVAGSGDQAKRMIELAAELGIGHKVLFTGFLRGRDIKRVFALADLYVMPSVSEPFGIAPLEAMAHDVPALISKSSGVSEVLTHALKVNFWDIDDMANKIIAVLRHPPLSNTLKEHGSFEVRKITWDGAATRCMQVYRSVISEMRAPAAVAN